MHYDIAEEFLASGQQEFECPECAFFWHYPPDAVASATKTKPAARRGFSLPGNSIGWTTARRGWSVFALSVCIGAAILISMPETVVRILPASAKIYAKAGKQIDPQGIAFRDLSYTRTLEGGVMVLAINGEISNTSALSKNVPVLRLALQDRSAQEIFTWRVKIKDDVLAPGQAVKFTTKLPSPPENAGAVQIRFAAAGEIG